MTLRKASILILIVAASAQMAYAVTTFRTKRLETIAQKTGISVPDTIGAERNVEGLFAYNGHALRVRTNAFGDVSHIGYRLFDDRMVEAYGRTPVFDFIERYALELDLRTDGRSPAERMEIDKVACTKGDVSMLLDMNPETTFNIEVIKRRMFRLTCTTGQQAVSLTVPADYQLIAGADAIELEDIMERDLSRVAPIASDAFIDEWADAEVARSGDLIIVDGGEYLSKMIRGDVYLKETGGRRTLLCEAGRPVQSVSNIMVTGRAADDIPLTLTVDRYGYRSTTTDVTLQQFVAFCKLEGCKLYFGTKTHTAERITGTLFALNEGMAYNHVLSVDFPLSIIEGEGGKVTGTVYAYIPLQNVTEKFFNQNTTKDNER